MLCYSHLCQAVEGFEMVYLHVSVKLHLPAINVCLYVRGDVPTAGFPLCTYTHKYTLHKQPHTQKTGCKEKVFSTSTQVGLCVGVS